MNSKPLNEAELRALAKRPATSALCAACAALWRPGWESISGAMHVSHLSMVASLRTEDAADRLDEYHPHGTNLWSAQAPVAVGWHPYNQCTLWRCGACQATFLRYTEFGGYYEDPRIRPLRAELITSPPAS